MNTTNELVFEICDRLWDTKMNYDLVATEYNLTLPELLAIATQLSNFGTAGSC